MGSATGRVPLAPYPYAGPQALAGVDAHVTLLRAGQDFTHPHPGSQPLPRWGNQGLAQSGRPWGLGVALNAVVTPGPSRRDERGKQGGGPQSTCNSQCSLVETLDPRASRLLGRHCPCGLSRPCGEMSGTLCTPRPALHHPQESRGLGDLGLPHGALRRELGCSELLLMLRGSRNIVCKCFCG